MLNVLTLEVDIMNNKNIIFIIILLNIDLPLELCIMNNKNIIFIIILLNIDIIIIYCDNFKC